MALVTVSPIRDRRYHWRYVQTGSLLPWWVGSAAQLLSLGTTATEQQVLSLYDGYSPDGQALVQNAGADNRQLGWELSTEEEKTVSNFAITAGDENLRQTLECGNDAVKAMFAIIEQQLVFTRRGQQGRAVEPCKIVAVVHQHFANRLNEPHLHKHISIPNIGLRPDGSAGTIVSKPLYANKMALGAFYRAEIVANLQRRLGLRIDVDGNRFRIVGVPESLREDSSTRRKQILGSLKSRGFHSAKAAEVATLDTRPAKDERPLPEMLKDWREQASQHGFTEAKAKALMHQVKPRDLAKGLAASLKEGLEHLQRDKSYFSEMELLERVCNAALKHGVSGQECHRGVQETLKRPEIIDLGLQNGFRQYTTQENLAIEDRLLKQVAERRDDRRFVLSERRVKKFLDQQLPLDASLPEDERLRNADQRKAIEHLALGIGQTSVLQGYAGTGKTHVATLYNELLKQHGFLMTGVALAGVAALNLQEATGTPSETLQLRLTQLRTTAADKAKHHVKHLVRAAFKLPTFPLGSFELSPRHVVFVDEAGMLSARQLEELAAYVFKAGARLVLVGDHRQVPPIHCGSALNAIAREVGQYELTHITRQGLDKNDPRPSWARDVVRHLANGESKEAIALLAERGKVSVAKDREAAISALLRDWSVEGARDQKNSLILAATNAEADHINRRCQALLVKSLIDAGRRLPEGAKNGDATILVGDRVRFTKKSRRLKVENGQRGEVIAIAARGKAVIVRTDNGQDVIVNNKQYPHLKHGWCSTVHSAQGSTVEFAYHLVGGRMTTGQLSYVMASRGRQQNRFYTDQHEAGQELSGLIKQAGLDRSKKIARDIRPLDRSPPRDIDGRDRGHTL